MKKKKLLHFEGVAVVWEDTGGHQHEWDADTSFSKVLQINDAGNQIFGH